jgi:hypothetical protein
MVTFPSQGSVPAERNGSDVDRKKSARQSLARAFSPILCAFYACFRDVGESVATLNG